MTPPVVIGDCTLYRGDCLDVLRALPAGSVGAVVTDPPYGVKLKKRTTKHTVRKASTNYQDTPEFVVSEVIPRVKAWLEFVGRGCLTPGNRCLQQYPPAADIGGVFQPNGAGCAVWGFICFHPVLFYGRCPYLAHGMGSRPNATRATHWLSEQVDHPCPKPVAFMRWMVERCTLPGETVVDPFAGSFTTAVACIQTGRKFIGCELSPEYFEIGRKRVEAAVAEQAAQLYTEAAA
jgi:predicted RNA methylase